MNFKNIPSAAIIEISKAFDREDDSWKDSKWSDIIANMKNIIHNFDIGTDIVNNEFAMTTLAKESMKIIHLAKHYPINDDRTPNLGSCNKLKIGLDIDEVIADFMGSYNRKFNIINEPSYWNYSYKMNDNLNELIKDKEFWINIPKLRDVPFEPALYCTSRSIPIEWTMEWLEKNEFPCRPVISIPFGESKLEHLKNAGINMFIDDKIETFKELNNNGIFTYLMDCAMNKYFNAGYKRIYDLNIL